MAFAVCYLKSEADQPELKMHVGQDAVGRIYLNTKQVYEGSGTGLGGAIYLPEDVGLKAGLNTLVFKIVSGRTGWGDCSICLTDAQGNPAKGIKVTLDPEAKDSR